MSGKERHSKALADQKSKQSRSFTSQINQILTLTSGCGIHSVDEESPLEPREWTKTRQSSKEKAAFNTISLFHFRIYPTQDSQGK